ncbi:MAG: CHAT domain-containing protein [Egibacteraceae bacterium]
MRFSADDRLETRGPLRVALDLEKLREQMYDVENYGKLLTDSLFGARGDNEVRHAFEQARRQAQLGGIPLRVRLLVGPTASELHAVWWETLRDPQDGTALLMDESILFSRYLASLDWRPIGVRPHSELRALVAIANPSDLAEYEPGGSTLRRIDVAKELERIERAMGRMPITPLASAGAATLARVVDGLRQGHDTLYLLCHGYLVDGEPQLLLEDASGRASQIPGVDLIDALGDLPRPPRLVVLASCQSAGDGPGTSSIDRGTLAALGPRMAEAGVPAVLAMQGDVSMQTTAQFMEVFFFQLNQDGQIDRALAVARRAVGNRRDWWAPVLFMRLRSGRVWYVPGTGGGQPGQSWDKWPALLNDIHRGRCTPVLGPALTDSILGSRQEIAQGWASQYNFPMAPHHREDLPHVAQFLAVNLNYQFPRDELKDYSERELRRRYARHLPSEARDWPLEELIKAVGRYRRKIDEYEPHAVLARLPLKTFVTTHPSDLLADALTAEGKDPQIELCQWQDEAKWPDSIFDDPTSQYEPSVTQPLVYHLLGHLQELDTLVLTEDDYFDYLIGVTRNEKLIPPAVRRALTDAGLLFLGFRLDDWDFRMLFRSIMSQPGRRWNRYTHVAAQIDPEEGRTIEPERARRYLESYFSQPNQIRLSIYWGSVDDFTRELSFRYKGSER